MGRHPVPEAGPRHPARGILKRRTNQEIADALSLSVASIKGARKCLKVTMADRIVAAFAASVPSDEGGKQEEHPESTSRTPKYAEGDHPAWKVLEEKTPKEIAAATGVKLEVILDVAETGLTSKLANKIAAAFPHKDEERMKDALRGAAETGGSEAPEMRAKPEQPDPEPPSAGPVKTYYDESVKRTLPPSMDFLKQLLVVGGYIIVPITPELVDKLKGA